MQEDFLHYIWKHKKIETSNLKTQNNELVSILKTGEHNHNTGPDFFNAQLKIGNQLWAGNVEIHVKSSDWYLHNHETDSNYDNVILHVVWEHDTAIFRKNNTEISTVELKNHVSNQALNNYLKLFNNSQKWINCENDFASISGFTMSNWLERLYFERLERKAKDINIILEQSKNNWEAVLFKLLAKNFGLKVNGDSFFSLANNLDFSIVRKQQSKQVGLEALFFGQTQLLSEDCQDPYFLELKKEYTFLKQKFNLNEIGVLPLQFFRLRPPNFPTIRLSQLATLYTTHNNVFSKIIKTNNIIDFYTIFKIEASQFWQTHYTFNKESKKSKKQLTKSFIDLLLINTVIPIKFSYAKQQGKNIDEEIVLLLEQIGPEKNSIVSKFNSLKNVADSALQSQALIQLKNEYCDKNKCLQCAIGNQLIIK
ncbi:DUF2851 family protein [Lacinutrix sp. 5H-3-7-4]|uniref:DUF2851 family protein n=1 Tax=Lacinutrix sp. (strain 5H-3-7-4) TaxID=983544 RepID=UPI00020A3B82|nr:DUF2851 family protein [Lacinutrix sp. 5H-3-7-4]AEH01656.1 hypothetical protein Lacal_1810 [Lacinutrix sp. 5H-3-7-4]